jgi:hypothetical protein
MHISKRSIFAVLVSGVIFAAGPVYAGQGRGGGGGPKTHPVKPSGSTTHMTAPKSSPAPKVQHGASTASHGPKSGTTTMAAGKGPKSTTKSPALTTASGKTKSTTIKGSDSTTASATKKSTTTTPPTETPSSPGTTVPLTPVQEKLQRNTNLASKLESRLPKGTDLMLASEGFRNLGQFVAAVNVSNNLKIPLVDLKASMVDDGLSLGQSIQKLRPTANATQEASLAESQATVLLNTTTTTSRKPMKTSGGAR